MNSLFESIIRHILIQLHTSRFIIKTYGHRNRFAGFYDIWSYYITEVPPLP